VKKDGKWGLMDTSATFALTPAHDGLKPTGDGLFGFKTGEKWGLLTLDGAVVAEPTFREVGVFSEGHAQARLA